MRDCFIVLSIPDLNLGPTYILIMGYGSQHLPNNNQQTPEDTVSFTNIPS